MKKLLYIVLFLLLVQCIGIDIVDDAVPPKIVIQNSIDSLKVGENYQFTALYFDESGKEAPSNIHWSCTNEQVVSITIDGLASAVEPGEVLIIATNDIESDTVMLVSGETTSSEVNIRIATLMTVSSYPLEGTATLENEDGTLYLRFSNDFNTTSALPGLYVYLSNNANSTSSAYEVGEVLTFSGAQEYTIDASVGINEFDLVLFFCKPFNVPVGKGELVP